MSASLANIRKALLAGLGAGVTALVAVWPDGVTAEEWGKVAAATIAAGVAVWAVPNKSKEG